MKLNTFFPGLVIGLVIGGGCSVAFIKPAARQRLEGATEKAKPAPAHWKWADSLDAVRAAPGNHRVLFENDQVRILDVILKPHEFERMHTHQYPSVMLGADDGDTAHFQIIYYRNGFDTAANKYIVLDSVRQTGGGPAGPAEADYMKPEGPHQIKNLSNKKIEVFRVEFKSAS